MTTKPKSAYKPRAEVVKAALSAIIIPDSPAPDARLFIVAVIRNDGKVGLPGGKVESEESLYVARARELAEETSLQVIAREILADTPGQWAVVNTPEQLAGFPPASSFETRVPGIGLLLDTQVIFNPRIAWNGDAYHDAANPAKFAQLAEHIRVLHEKRLADSENGEVFPVLLPLDVYFAREHQGMLHTQGQWLTHFRTHLESCLKHTTYASQVGLGNPPARGIYGVATMTSSAAGTQNTPGALLRIALNRLGRVQEPILHPGQAAELFAAQSPRMEATVRLTAFLVPGPVRTTVEGNKPPIGDVPRSGPRTVAWHRTMLWYAGDRLLFSRAHDAEILLALTIEAD